MRPRSEVWQGCFGYWQNYFIQQNLLLLGYIAWNSYLTQGRGIVACELADAVAASIDWQVDQVDFSQTFIPQSQVELYLQRFELMQDTTTLLNAVETYEPTQAIIVLVVGNGTVDINLLQLKVSPIECYQQVQQRWAEFCAAFQPQGDSNV